MNIVLKQSRATAPYETGALKKELKWWVKDPGRKVKSI